MVELLGVNLGTMGSGFGDVKTFLSWAFLVIAVGALLYLIYYLFTFKNTLVVREIINGRKIIKTYKWKIKKDRNKNLWLVTAFNRLKKQLPPSESVDLTTKAKKWVEAWKGDDSESFIWCHDNFNYQTFKEENKETFQPLMTAEREILAIEMVKSDDYKKKGLGEILLQLAPVIAIVVLIAVISFTIGDVTTALTDFSKEMTAPLAKVADSFERASENLAGIQNPDAPAKDIVTEVPN